MNLLYFIGSYGRENMAGAIHPELGHEIRRRGHTFSVFCLAAERERAGGSAGSVEDGIPVHRALVAGRWPLDAVNALGTPLLKYPRFLPGLAQYVRYLRSHPEIDLVLAEGAFPVGGVAGLARLVVPTPLLVTVAGGDFISSVEAEYGYARFAVPRALARLALRQAAAIRATTAMVREHVAGLGADMGRVSVLPRNLAAFCFLPPGSDADAFRRDAREILRERHGLRGDPLLVCAGRLLPIKGFDDAIRALGALLPEFPGARLLLLGPDRTTVHGSYQRQLQDLAVRVGVADAVLFQGAVEHGEMKTFLAAADLLLVPSILEGMNKAAVEAAAVATPVVVSRTAGIAEAAARAGAGVVITPRAPTELAGAVAALLRDDARRQAVGRAGVAFAARFTTERTAGELLELCVWAVRAHRSAGGLPEGPPSFEV